MKDNNEIYKDSTNDSNENPEEIKRAKENIIEYSQNSLDMENKREANIYATSNTIITSISIILVFTSTLALELLDRLKSISPIIIVFSIILIIILLASLFCSLLVHFPYKKVYPRKGIDLMNYVNNNYEQYVKGDGFLDQKINDIDLQLEKQTENNKKRKNSLLASTIILYSYLLLLIIFGIVILLVIISR